MDVEHQGNKVLAAYVVVEDSDKKPDVDTLLQALGNQLPEYMMPASITVIDNIPLTVNGKLDRKALPDPVWAGKDSYRAPRNEVETTLCQIWQELLGIDQIGIDDNFFRLGGDSIISIQLVNSLRSAGFNLRVKQLFNAPTVRGLAEALVCPANVSAVNAEQGELTGQFGLLPIQSWFFEQARIPHHWNLAFMMWVPGEMGTKDIAVALEQLTRQHDMLRAVFVETDHGIQQAYQSYDATPPELKTLDVSLISEQALKQQLTQWQVHFDLYTGYTWQAAHLTSYGDGSARLFFAAHHLIIDWVSWRIMTEDLRQLLSGGSLPPKTSSYRQWVDTIHRYSEAHLSEVPYWTSILDTPALSMIPTEVTIHSVNLSIEMTRRVLSKTGRNGQTEVNGLLLSALAISMTEVFGQSEHVITMEGHGRPDIDASIDVSRTIGWFTVQYPVKLVTESSIGDTIARTSASLKDIPNKGIGYSALYQSGHLTSPLPRVSFNYLGQLSTTNTKALLSLAQENCGDTVAADNLGDTVLLINSAVQQGQLAFDVMSRLGKEQGQTFTAAFECALLAVVDYLQ